jgi:glycosyltransferase involved in cell wall biosynthesis
VKLLPDIPNGVDGATLDRGLVKRGYAAALGRVCPEKGFHLALDAAVEAGVPLLLAGSVFPYPEHEAYFSREIARRLDHLRRFLGPLGFIAKRRLLGGARCLLVPSLAPETSSLVAMEALACGTPVVAFPNGALADIIEHGTTGFLVRDRQEMTEAIAAAPSLDPETCRAAARARFPAARMVERYLALYRQLVSSQRQVA